MDIWECEADEHCTGRGAAATEHAASTEAEEQIPEREEGEESGGTGSQNLTCLAEDAVESVMRLCALGPYAL